MGLGFGNGTFTQPGASFPEAQVRPIVADFNGDGIATELHLPNTNGVVVMKVDQGSPAEEIGLQRGDVILRVGTEEVKSEEEFWNALNKGLEKSKDGVLLRIWHNNSGMTITLPPVN